MEKFDKSQLKTLCRGNRTDRGWEQDAEGNWVPSVHDRRRLAVTHALAIAEVHQSEVIPPMVGHALAAQSRDLEDYQALLANFEAWNLAR